MKAILGDVNIQGHLQILLTHWESPAWREFWTSLNLVVLTFDDLHLSPETSDAIVWQTCQREQLILVTANRNADGPDSLEATLRTHNTATDLPVFTIANADRVILSRDYGERVAVRLLDYLLDIDRVRGAGRLYLP